MAAVGPPRGQLGQGVTSHDPVQVGVTQRAEGRAVGTHQELGPAVGTVDDGDQRHRAVVAQGGGQRLVHHVGHRYQSRGSMKR